MFVIFGMGVIRSYKRKYDTDFTAEGDLCFFFFKLAIESFSCGCKYVKMSNLKHILISANFFFYYLEASDETFFCLQLN